MAAPVILLTGTTGFVGRQILRALAERGCRVRAVVRQGRTVTSGAIESIVTSPDIFGESAGRFSASHFFRFLIIRSRLETRVFEDAARELCFGG